MPSSLMSQHGLPQFLLAQSLQEVRQAELRVDAQKAVIDEATAELAGVIAESIRLTSRSFL